MTSRPLARLGATLLLALACRLPAAAADAAAEAPPAATNGSATPSPEEERLEQLSIRHEILATENAIADEEDRARRRALADERIRLELEYAIREQRTKIRLAELEAERAKLTLENAVRAAEQQRELAALVAENGRLAQENTKQQALLQQALAGLTADKEALVLENALLAERQRRELAELETANKRLALENTRAQELSRRNEIARQDEANEIQLEMAKLGLRLKQAEFEQREYQEALAKVQTDLSLRAQKEEWDNEANRDPEYLPNPLVDGVLTVSDRRIALNGPIIGGTADHVTSRIHYFNNKSSELPIFIVIDRSPGGSVMEGYRILKAMEASSAPVHVIVKSFAASMAAVIAAMAEHSYAYPNAIILHHQPWSVAWGNLTQQKEQLDIFKEWARRLHVPLAKKMEVTLEEFYSQMYERNSDGDWQEFADNAQTLKWIDEVVDEIRETGVKKEPKDPSPSLRVHPSGKKDQGIEYVRLPRLHPFDFYFLYNPAHYYRWE